MTATLNRLPLPLQSALLFVVLCMPFVGVFAAVKIAPIILAAVLAHAGWFAICFGLAAVLPFAMFAIDRHSAVCCRLAGGAAPIPYYIGRSICRAIHTRRAAIGRAALYAAVAVGAAANVAVLLASALAALVAVVALLVLAFYVAVILAAFVLAAAALAALVYGGYHLARFLAPIIGRAAVAYAHRIAEDGRTGRALRAARDYVSIDPAALQVEREWREQRPALIPYATAVACEECGAPAVREDGSCDACCNAMLPAGLYLASAPVVRTYARPALTMANHAQTLSADARAICAAIDAGEDVLPILADTLEDAGDVRADCVRLIITVGWDAKVMSACCRLLLAD